MKRNQYLVFLPLILCLIVIILSSFAIGLMVAQLFTVPQGEIAATSTLVYIAPNGSRIYCDGKYTRELCIELWSSLGGGKPSSTLDGMTFQPKDFDFRQPMSTTTRFYDQYDEIASGTGFQIFQRKVNALGGGKPTSTLDSLGFLLSRSTRTRQLFARSIGVGSGSLPQSRHWQRIVS